MQKQKKAIIIGPHLPQLLKNFSGTFYRTL